jgi:putative membrane protein
VLTTLAIAAHVGGPFVGFHWGFILIPLFWILLFVLVFGIFGRRWRQHAWQHGHGGPWGHYGHYGAASRSAESSLAERFAQGDIDEKEYRARLEVLRANAFPAAPPKG